MKKPLLVIVLVLVAATGHAQTPDGETPANEGVCDELLYATPGLYGLCVAFCEAQDCEPDFSAQDPFEICNPSNPKLLEIYNKKKQETDPPMPCLKLPCPCWSAEEIDDLVHPTEITHQRCTNVYASEISYKAFFVQDYIAPGGDVKQRAHMLVEAGRFHGDYVCWFTHQDLLASPPVYVSRLHSWISASQAAACRTDVMAEGIARGIDCWYP